MGRYQTAVQLLLTMVALFYAAPGASQTSGTFANPVFNSQDPWVVQWNGNYYYSDSANGTIRIRKSSTLTGLGSATAQMVWSAALSRSGLRNVWAPEIHLLEGSWYLYFSGDRGDGRKRLYVLEGGGDPFDNYVTGDTGFPGGLLADSTGGWAIDPDVFYGPDHKLYLAWSCSNDPLGAAPQFLCLAGMGDPLHIAGATVRISQPDAAWETRTAAVEEGPVGFVRGGSTYLTYSASASWTADDYAVGLLVNASGDLLNPGAWVKSGPIFDHHGKTYGPGSVVFVTSPDGTETWSVYHAYDQLGCPAWSCRSIRMQKVIWSDAGLPLLGFPVDPGVVGPKPSGDSGSATGWGDSGGGTQATAGWTYNGSSSADSTGADFAQTFRANRNALAWTVSAEISAQHAVAGVFALYKDPGNQVQAWIDPVLGIFGSRVIVGGVDLGLQSYPLSPGFDTAAAHTIRVGKSGTRVFSFSLDGVLYGSRNIPLDSGQMGIFARGADARFRNVEVTDNGFGWGDAQGDAAEGFAKADAVGMWDGYLRGLWDVGDPATLASVASGGDWNAIYRNSPVYGDYSIEVEALADSADAAGAWSGAGLIVCHDDRNNQVTLWVNAMQHSVELVSVMAGVLARQMLVVRADLDWTQFHRLAARRTGDLFSFYLDGGIIGQQAFELVRGTPGLASGNNGAHFRGFGPMGDGTAATVPALQE